MSKIDGIKFAPIPCNSCGPEIPFDKSGEEAGSIPTIFIFEFFDFKYFPVPVIVPPVPIPATKISICPSVSSQISGPVVSR